VIFASRVDQTLEKLRDGVAMLRPTMPIHFKLKEILRATADAVILTQIASSKVHQSGNLVAKFATYQVDYYFLVNAGEEAAKAAEDALAAAELAEDLIRELRADHGARQFGTSARDARETRRMLKIVSRAARRAHSSANNSSVTATKMHSWETKLRDSWEITGHLPWRTRSRWAGHIRPPGRDSPLDLLEYYDRRSWKHAFNASDCATVVRDAVEIAYELMNPAQVETKRSALQSLLRLASCVLPSNERDRWIAEWLGELGVMPRLSQRISFTLQTLRGIPALAIVLWNPLLKEDVEED
jgi:hypothetical protein